MSIIRALLAAGLALGLSTQPTAAGTQCLTAMSTASIADIDQVIQEFQNLRDDKATKEAGKLAPLTRKEQLAFTFPGKGKVGMMKGGVLGKTGYSKKTNTFPACRDACMDDCDCLAFHWSGRHRHCGLKDTGELYMSVSVDNPYQKTFRSFKRLDVTGCTPATTTAGTTTAEPTTSTTTATTTTTSTATTTTTTTSTTAEPTTTTTSSVVYDVKGNDGNGIDASGTSPDGASSIQFIDLGAGAFEAAGEISSVKYHVSRANQAGMKFQVYRPVSGTIYNLVSETSALQSPTLDVVVAHDLVPPLQFQAGDYIGWVHTGQSTIPFSSSGGEVRWRYGIMSVGVDIDFNGFGARIYAYEVTYTT